MSACIFGFLLRGFESLFARVELGIYKINGLGHLTFLMPSVLLRTKKYIYRSRRCSSISCGMNKNINDLYFKAYISDLLEVFPKTVLKVFNSSWKIK